MELDFTKKRLLTESWMRAFADWNKTFLRYMYGKDVTMTADLKAHQRLSEDDEEAYSRAIVAEKVYLDNYVHYGEDHPQSLKTKEELDQAIAHFEQITRITWPFKDEG